MTLAETSPPLETGRRLVTEVLHPLKGAFVGKEEVIDLLGVCLAAGENLFLLGPPGTAKSALVRELAARLEGRVFDYLLTRFTEPNELFGPFDIRRLREGELVTNTEGMLPEADIAFLDELLNANSAILNSLLMVLHERVFRRGRETRSLPLLMTVGASNRLPEDDALGALFDRFLLRVRCDNVERERLEEVLAAGWRLEGETPARGVVSLAEVRRLHEHLPRVEVAGVRRAFAEVITRLRAAGIAVSDRRAVKLQRVVAASALLCGRDFAEEGDFWVLRYIWDSEEQQQVIGAIVDEHLAGLAEAPEWNRHPRAQRRDQPDPEELARDLAQLDSQLASPEGSPVDRAVLRDRVGLLAARCQWVHAEPQRSHLEAMLADLWRKLEVPA